MMRLLTRPWFVALLFVAVVLAIYAPALHGPPLWDDGYLVGENPFFRSPLLVGEAFRHWLFNDSYSLYYRPVQNISYLLDYWLWRGAPVGYHLGNCLLHATSAFLLYLLLLRLLPVLGAAEKTKMYALAIALVWVVHPIHNAAVAYISGRADSLAALFAIASWLSFESARCAEFSSAKTLLFTVAGLLALIALCSKEIALLWMVVFLGFELFVRPSGTQRARVACVAGALVILGCYLILRGLPPPKTPPPPDPTPWAMRTQLALRAAGDYSALVVFPDRLTMERQLSQPPRTTWWQAWHRARFFALPFIGGAALLLVPAACFWRRDGRQLRLFGAAWSIVMFLPISNLWPLNAQVAEHWIYHASIGLFLFATGVVVALSPRFARPVTGLLGVFVVALCIRTWVRAHDWADPETFFRRTMEAGGISVRLLNNLAAVYGTAGDLSRQETILRRTIAAFPDYAPAQLNLGVCLSKQGRSAEAEPLLKASSSPEAARQAQFRQTWGGALHLAQTKFKEGQLEQARAILAEAGARFPGEWTLVSAQASLLAQQLGPHAGLPVLEAFARDHWWHRDAWFELGRLQAQAGDVQAAVTSLRRAGELDIWDARPLSALAELEIGRNRLAAAIDAQREAVHRAPEDANARMLLAALLGQASRNASSSP